MDLNQYGIELKGEWKHREGLIRYSLRRSFPGPLTNFGCWPKDTEYIEIVM